MPDRLIERKGYRPLTRDVKAHIFGLNATRIFGYRGRSRTSPLPVDYLSKIKMSYEQEGPEPAIDSMMDEVVR